MIKYELVILSQTGGRAMIPVVPEQVVFDTKISGTPGELHFTCIKTDGLDFSEGDSVRFSVDGNVVFFGFIFEKKRDKLRDKANPEDTRRRGERNEADRHHIKVVAYDQLRYLKNKDTYVYEGKTASQLIEMICGDFQIRTGEIAQTSYVIPRRREEDKTLFDIIQYALDVTLIQEKIIYVLYDDAGNVTLKNIEDMKVDLMIDSETACDFEYSTNINDNTFNTVKLVRTASDENGTGKDLIIKQDIATQQQWGVLQYYEKIDNNEINLQDRAEQLLSLYNKKSRHLKIRKALGDKRVRAGTSVIVNLDLGDTQVNNVFVVTACKHVFYCGMHFMDLDLRGGDFS